MSRPLLDLGEGLEVRVLEPDDAEQIFDLVEVERQRLRPWMPWVDPTTSPDDVRAFIDEARSSRGLGALGIFVDGAYVGGAGLRVDRRGLDGELGYWIDAAHEGHGLVSRTCRALIQHAFVEMGLHRVTICAAPDNARSRAIPERLGFTEEGRLREAERMPTGYHDLVVYGLLRQEWRASG
ncbi:MAG TPA: GNAT family protein [Actinomycetota bacterium]|nr:GNAT family protein [Actinomycetota bacterium]